MLEKEVEVGSKEISIRNGASQETLLTRRERTQGRTSLSPEGLLPELRILRLK
jgi:hypothetical protein